VFGPIAKIRRHCIVSIAVSNWNFFMKLKALLWVVLAKPWKKRMFLY